MNYIPDMRKTMTIFSLLAAVLLGITLGLYGLAAAAGGLLSAEEQLLLDLINTARKDPLSIAESLGMDRAQLIEAFPELKKVFTHGLPPLSFNEKLYAAASAHTEDMLAKQYYGSEAPDGSTPRDRIKKAGYEAWTTGESLGMVGFNNFIDPERAVHLMFDKMFRDEVDPSRTTPRNILNPDLREAAVSIGSGPFTQGGVLWNAYLVTCDFASPAELYATERSLWRLINEARRSPLRAIADAGIDEAAAREALGENAFVLDGGLLPLAWNQTLFESALRHNLDMTVRGYFDTVSPEGTTPAERIAAAGFDPDAPFTGESLGVVVLDAPDDPKVPAESDEPATPAQAVGPFETARLLFEAMLRTELDPAAEKPPVILGAEATEMGIAVLEMPAGPDKPEGDKLFVAVLDVARPTELRTYLFGNVFQDLDEDRAFTLGEGVAGWRVTIEYFGGAELGEIVSGLLGNYQLEIPGSGFYHLIVSDDKGSQVETRFLFWFQGSGGWMDVIVPNREADPAQSGPVQTSESLGPSLAISW